MDEVIALKIIDSRGVENENPSSIADKIFISVLAAENISKYDVVTTDGQKANSSTISHKNKILGIATGNITSGNSGEIQVYGDMDNPAWSWTSMTTIYLNGTSIGGAPTSGFVIALGLMRTATKIFIDIKIPIQL